ncbi:MAG: Ig-like domain-containing protein [Bacteroidales bacterium]
MRTLSSVFQKILLIVLLFTTSNVIFAQPSWTRVDYTNSTAFVGWVRINHYDADFPVQVEVGDYIGAFVDAECRMIAEVFEHNGELYVSSVIHGGDVFDGYPSDDESITSNPEEVEYKVWDNSANQEIAAQVQGTMFTDPGGEILDYEIGKPNTNSELESLEITDVLYSPVFSSGVLDYTADLSGNGTLPLVIDYITSLVDSRATVSVDAATDVDTDNVTTITVTAEDGSTTEYTITFNQEQCQVAAPTFSENPVIVCQYDQSPDLSGYVTGTNVTWYSTETSDDGTTTAPTLSTENVDTVSYWVSQTDGCESDRAEITVRVSPSPTGDIYVDNPTLCQGETTFIDAHIYPVVQGHLMWSDNVTADNYTATFEAVEAGQSEVTYDFITDDGCYLQSGIVSTTITVNSLPEAEIVSDDLSYCGEVSDVQLSLQAVAQGVDLTAAEWDLYKDGTIETTGGTGLMLHESAPAGDYYAVVNLNGCEYTTPTVTVQHIPQPGIPVVSDTSYCVDEQIQDLSTTVDGETGATLNWYADESKSTVITDISNPAAGTYYVSQTIDGCESDVASLTIEINELPTVTVESPTTSVCSDDNPISLTLTPSTGGTLNGEGVTQDNTFDPQGLTVDQSYTVEYSYEDANGCSNTDQIDMLVESCECTVPEPDVVAEVEYCQGDAADVLTATATEQDATITWYNSAMAELAEAPTPSTDNDGTVTYYVSQETTCEGKKATVTVTVKPQPDAPVVEDVAYCEGDVVEDLSAVGETGATFNWFEDEAQNTPLTDVSNPVAGTYYVTQTVDGCESDVAALTVDINSLPSVSISVDDVQNNEVCLGDAVSLSVVPSDGTLLVNGSEVPMADLDNAIQLVDDYTLEYIASNQYGCTDTAKMVLSVIDCECQVAELDVADVEYCQGEDAAALSATPTETDAVINWYDSELKKLNEAPVPATDVANDYTYYVSQETATCEGPKDTVTVVVHDKPSSLDANVISYCEGEEIQDLSATGQAQGADINWYEDSDMTIPLTDLTNPAAGTYYVTQTVGECESDPADITINIQPIPEEPVVADVSTCDGSSASLESNVTANWYTNIDGETSIHTGTSFTPNVTEVTDHTFYVSQTQNSCESARVPVTYSVISNPELTVKDTVIEVGETVPDLTVSTASENTVNWYTSDEELITEGVSADGLSYSTGKTAVGTYYYYVEAVNGNCSSGLQQITLEISDCSLAQISVEVSDDAICFGDDNPEFSVTNDVSAITGTVKWYDNTQLVQENLVHTGTTFTPSVTEVGTHTYYVVQEDECVSAQKSVSFTINALPEVSISAPETISQTDDPVAISVSPSGGSIFGSGITNNQFDPSGLLPKTYTISYSYTDNSTGCENSTTHSIEVTPGDYADRTQLGDTIARAENVYNQYVDSDLVNDSDKTMLANAIATAQNYYDDYQQYTDDQLLTQTNELSEAIADFINAVPEINLDGLITKINEAQSVYDDNSNNQGSETGEYPESAFTALQDAINNAQSYVDTPPNDQNVITNQEQILDDAIQEFYNSVNSDENVESISVSDDNVHLVVDAEYEPTVTFSPAGASGDIIWSSSNTSVASVVASTGTVTAKAEGTTQITGALAANDQITVQYIVQVSGIPQIVSTEMTGSGDELVLEFSEQMQEPSNDVYTDLKVIQGSSYLSVNDVILDPNNSSKYIVELGSVINNPDDVTITYSGNSLQSVAGAPVETFEVGLGTDVSVDDDISKVNVFVYPTSVSNELHIEGVADADKIYIISRDGKFVADVPVTSQNVISVDVSDLSKGTYTVNIQFDKDNSVNLNFVRK